MYSKLPNLLKEGNNYSFSSLLYDMAMFISILFKVYKMSNNIKYHIVKC